jgi:hypothetical protein
MSKGIVVLFAPEYEELDACNWKLRIQEASHDVRLAGTGGREDRGEHGYPPLMDGPFFIHGARHAFTNETSAAHDPAAAVTDDERAVTFFHTWLA